MSLFCLQQKTDKFIVSFSFKAPIVRHEAGEALAAIGDFSVIPLLEEYAQDEVKEVAGKYSHMDLFREALFFFLSEPVGGPSVVGDLNFMFSHYKEVKFLKYMGQLPFASIYLLKAQIVTTIYLFPFFVTGSFPVKSTCTRHIIFGVTGIGISGGTGAVLNTLFLCPQIIHSFVFIRTYFSPLYQ